MRGLLTAALLVALAALGCRPLAGAAARRGKLCGEVADVAHRAASGGRAWLAVRVSVKHLRPLVYLDGRALGVAPFSVKVPAGRRVLTMTAEGFDTGLRETIDFAPGVVVTIVIGEGFQPDLTRCAVATRSRGGGVYARQVAWRRAGR